MTNWRAYANCAGLDVDMFFPEHSQVDIAVQKVCANCTVRAECFAFALADPDISGYWAGTYQRQRQKHRSGRQKITF